ncbi:hypothetical protein PTKIN_Ptkin16aG0531300 [Pterospermum kingtungense]
MEMMSNGDCPVDILIEILLKLPVKSIVRFKSVAKTWNHLFQNPTFVSQHHNISKKKSKHLVVCNWDNWVWRIGKRKDIVIRSFVDEALVSYHDLRRQLPSHFAAMNDFFYICVDNGFGLDPLTNDYKVIYMRDYRNLNTYIAGRHYAIYKMSTDSWRVLKEEEVPFSPGLVIRQSISNACVNGVYYWLADSKVLAFYLGSEVFQLIESALPEPKESGQLLILNDCISFWDAEFDINRKISNDVWMLNDEGQWTKVLKIELPVLQVKMMLGFWKVDRQVLVESVSGQLLVYDFESKEFKEMGIQNEEPDFFLQLYIYQICTAHVEHFIAQGIDVKDPLASLLQRFGAGMEMMSNGNWPGDILIEILLILPVKSIIRFKSVAKIWNHLFQNPSFVSQHLSISKKKSKYLVCNWDNLEWDIGKHEDIVIRSFVDEILVSFHDLCQQLPPHLAPINVFLNVCVDNGLFCLLDCRNFVLTLWNPATRELRNLPECNQSFPPKTYIFVVPPLGFGLDPLSNDYKVIYLRNYTDLDAKINRRHYAIYKLSTDSWRVLKEEEEVPFSVDLVIRPSMSNACVNGVYYWLAFHRMPRPGLAGFIDNKVVAFHLGSEVFQLIESPLSETSEILGQLLLLHDRISICDTDWHIHRQRSYNVWVLNDEGQWTKVLKIEPVLEFRKMFGFCKNSKVFIESSSEELLVYDLESHEFKEMGIQSEKPGYIFRQQLTPRRLDT